MIPDSPVLFLIPTALSESGPGAFLDDTLGARVRSIRHFVVESEKIGRRELKKLGIATPIQQLDLKTLSEHSLEDSLGELLAPLRAGHDIGLLSDAGAPAVADPGALLVRAAHENKFSVQPLVGPSSLLLALMASGLEGQRFAFVGYLPVHDQERRAKIRELEQRSRQQHETILAIETPYRTDALLKTFVSELRGDTRLCVASALLTGQQRIEMRRIREWKSVEVELGKQPTLFLFLADG